MPNGPKYEAKVDALAAVGAKPQTLHDGGVVLQGQGRVFVMLVRPTGSLTNAGVYCQWRYKGVLETKGLDLTQVAVREGNTEYITAQGKKRATRRWDAGSMEFQFTKLGESIKTSGGTMWFKSLWMSRVPETTERLIPSRPTSL